MGRKIIIALVILISYLSQSVAQNISITYENPSDANALTVCDSSLFQITLTNSSTTEITDILLTIDLPTGVSYNTGSVNNATESNISNPNNPVFSLPNLSAGQAQNITLYAFADCSLIDAINAMQLFSNNISVSYNGGNNTVTTTPYNIETPLLVLENTGTLIHSGTQGDVFTRTFTITNTRLGALSAFTFRDSHQGGIEISSALGTDISTQDNVFEIVLSGADFATVGDGDGLLELDESITITEEVTIISCGIPLANTTSEISATWGCEGNICQSTTPVEGFIAFEIAFLEPELSFTPINDSIPMCYCTGEPIRNGLIISNISSNTATDITIALSQVNNFAGIDPVSFFIDSSGIITPFPNVISADTIISNNDLCNISNATYKDAELTLPMLGEGESFTLYWDTYVCAIDCFSVRFSNWEYRYDYFSLCPPIPNIFGNGEYLGENPDINSYLETPASSTFNDSSINTIQYNLLSPELLNSTEQLTIEFEIPCGLTWLSGNELILDGQTPESIDINNNTEISVITATYNAPFSSDSISLFFDLEFFCDDICEEVLCKDTVITSCTDLCSSDVPIGLSIGVNSYLQMVEGCPTECNLNTCTSLPIEIDCILPLCEEYIPGYAEYTYSAVRTNFGLPDNNDDRLADIGGTMDLDLVRKDRLIAGDTVEVNVNSIVRIDEPGYTFPAGQILINIYAEGLFGENIALFEDGGIEPIDRSVTIYDNSSDTYYDCGLTMPILINTVVDGSNFSFQFDISPAVLSSNGCNVPIDFVYDAGDSILFKQQFRIIHNLVPAFGSSTPPISDLNISPEVFLLDENSVEPNDDWFNCGCQGVDMQLSGYRYDIISGIHAIPDCDTSVFVGGSLFSFVLGMGNFFPFEHRSLGQLIDWEIEIPDGFSIVDSKITSLELQQNIPLSSQVPISPLVSNNTYQYNLLPFQTPTLDEGFSLLLQSRFLANCTLSGSHPMSIHAVIEPASNLIFPSIIDTTVTKPSAIRMLTPNISLDATFFNNTSYDDQAEWDFTLTNNVSTVASFTSGSAKNVWVRPFSTTGLVTNFELSDANSGMAFSQVNGIFQLGDLDSLSSLDLHLTATNSSCVSELIELHYGWNCELYNNPITTACSDKVAFFSVISPPAALEQSVESPIGPHLLCDTIDYYTITVFNADLGTAYNSTIETQLPPGLFIISGSSQIAYPSGNSFTTVADPIDTGTGTLSWNISALQDSIGANGLPGFIFNPNHSYQLRFKLYTDCAFVAGSYPIFFANAEQICGLSTNTLAEAADPIELNGLVPPYQSSIIVTSPVPTISCENSIPIEVSITADASTVIGDSIFVTLPSGISYVPGSITGNINMLIQEPNIEVVNNLDILKWPLMAGVSPGISIAFDFQIEGFEDLECGNQFLLMQSVGPASALCTADNSVCDILIETGSNLTQLNIDRAAYELSNFEITLSPSGGNDIINYEILVNNNGFLSSPPIIVDFYLDSDNSGDWSLGDVFLTNETFNNVITNGGSVTLSGSFTTTIGQACDLIAVIDQAKHCACAGDEQILNTTITYLIPDEVILCSGESQMIGIPENPGSVYQWIPELGLTCDDCSMSEIDLTNSSSSVNILTYTLTEDDGQGCVTAYAFTLEVQPTIGINNAIESICDGEPITLETVSVASSYLWSGPGIVNPTLPTQTVSPDVSSVYTVQLIDAFGCSSTDSIQVIVSEPPTAFAGNDTLFCESSVVQLQAFFDATYTYEWSPANFLDDSISSNPTIINNVATTYFLTVTNDEGCQNTDQINVDFGAAPTLTGQTEHAICPGDSVLLVFNGALNYSWSPATDLSCIDCPEVYASPETSTVYTLTGSDNIGCSSAIAVAVNLLSDGNPIEQMADLCEGDTIIVNGLLISEAGIYCDTLVSQFTGCDSIHCIVVEDNTELDTEEALVICEGESIEINGINYSATGTYCNTSQTLAGCDSSHCVVLEVRENPVINILPEVTIELGDTVALGPFPSEYNYSWTPSEGLSCDDCFNPLAFPIIDTEYRAIVSDSIGCNNEFVIQTRTTTPICLPPHVFLPNAFTPNGDNENDVLRVYGNSIERLHLMIFNRWGEKVFETFEVDGFWDGTFKGKLLPTDVFGYYLELDCIGGESYSDKGNVTLLR